MVLLHPPAHVTQGLFQVGRFTWLAEYVAPDVFKTLFTVVCYGSQPNASILLGAKMTGACELEKKENLLCVPQTVLWREGHRFFVFVERSNRYRKQYVELGMNDSQFVEITQGLSYQDAILRIESFSDYEQVLMLINESNYEGAQ